MSDLRDHEARNQAAWDADSDDYQARHGEQLATGGGLAWGTTNIPEAELQVLGVVAGKDTFADPYRTVPEAARLLRPGGLFAFNHGSTIETLCWSAGADGPGDRLVTDYFDLHAMVDDGETIFNLGYGAWIRVFRANGFIVEDLLEPRPGPDVTSTYRDAAALAWSRRWPAESIWRLLKT
ncbi:MAG: hypothetical protein ACSLFN_07495 [Candidatus Limnocylindrales bacterium]